MLRFGERREKGRFPSDVHELATFSGQPSGMCVFGLLLALLLSLTPLGALPLAAGPCILPVTGEEPLTEVERDQPYRLATNPITIPGQGGLLLRPVNRADHLHFYEIVGTIYRARARPAPGSNIIDGEVQLAVGGDYFLPGWDDRVLWQLPAGSDAWQEAWPGQKWWGTAYDEGTQDFYAGFAPKAQLLRWDGKTFVPAGPMPTALGEAPSPLTEDGLPLVILTLPDAGGTFAVAVDWYNEDRRSLWFRPSGGAWAVVATQQDLDRLTPGLRFPGPLGDADVSKDGQTVRLFSSQLKDASVLLQRGPDGWRLAEAAPHRPWVKHRGSGIRLAWSGELSQDLTEPVLLFFERSVAFKPPVLEALDPGTLVPRPVTEVTPRVEIGAKTALNLSKIVEVPGVYPLLVKTKTGWMAFDGNGFRTLPGWEANRIGESARISRVGRLVLIESLKGVFRVTDKLDAELVQAFPEGMQRSATTSITWLEEAALFVVVSRDDGVYTSKDFASFERVPSPVPITSDVAALPDRAGMLLVGTDGLYTLEAECPPGG